MSIPVELGREAAQEAAREELAKQIYREAGPGLVQRAIGWLLDRVGDLLDETANASPGGLAGLAILMVVLVVAVVVVRLGIGPLAKRSASEQALFVGRTRTSGEHRTAADEHAAAGRWDEAVRERLRAIVRSLEERTILEPRPGRTADEAAGEAGLALPACAAGLRAAARTFDEVWYGGRPAGPDNDAALRELDDAVRAARPVRQEQDGPLRAGAPQ
jgi:hypothetical protein